MMQKGKTGNTPWYAGKNSDALFYLLIAIFFVELIIGGVAFFYGIIHSVPETPGGPPMARFPWLVWSIAAILCPVGLLLIVHLAGTWLSKAMDREENGGGEAPDADQVPEGMRRFYATVRNAPTLVVLLGILLLGAGLFVVDGAFSALMRLFHALLPYMPWICGSLGGLLAICFLAHAIMVYRQRKMEQEYAWRREVLDKTGIVLLDRKSLAIGGNDGKIAPLEALDQNNRVLDVTSQALPPSDNQQSPDDEKPKV